MRFELAAEPGSQVIVAGTFNEYKFAVNGVWLIEPKCPEWATSGFGFLNNVVHV